MRSMRFLKIWLLGFLVFSLLGVSSGRAAEKIIVGLSSVNLAFLPVYVTQEKKFFEQEGLEVLLVMFNAGTTNLQALVGGDIQIMGTSVVEPISGRNVGVDIKYFWGVCNIMPFQIYSQPELKSMKEAKGKKFAISRFGSLSDFLTRSALIHSGINPKEVTILQIGSTPARYAALSAKGVDATVMWFPVTETARRQGYNKLLDLREIFPEWPFELFAAKSSWLEKNRDTVVKFLRAFKKGVRHTLENREEAIEVIKKYVKVDPAVAAAGYDQYRDSFPRDGRIAEKAISVVIEQEFENGRIKKKFSVDEIIDRSFINLLGGK